MRQKQAKLILLLIALLLLIPSTQAQDDPSPYDIALQRIEEARQTSATELDLSELGLTELPPQIGQLNNLQVLWLYRNQLTELPSQIKHLINLQELDLRYNQLITLPPEIGDLGNLKLLYLDENQLQDLPDSIGKLSKLCFLDINNNNLKNLPYTLGTLSSLTQIELCNYRPSAFIFYGNPLISPPPEVVEQGTEAILDYLRNRAWYHTQRLILGAASGVGLLVLLILGFRLKQGEQRKAKVKRDAA